MYRGIDADDNHGVIVRADHVRGGGGGSRSFGRGIIIIIIIIMVATVERRVYTAHHPLRISPFRNWSEVFAGAR